VDSGILAQATVFATIALLPFASLLILDVETTRRMMSGYWNVWDGKGHRLASFTGWHWTVDVRLALMFLGLSVSTYLSILCWTYRPQMDERADRSEDAVVESPS
jgi:hypothetical protein